MRLLAADLRQPAAIQLAARDVDPSIRPSLGRGAIVVSSRRTHHRVDSCLQSGAAFSVELSVDAKHAVEGLAQMKEAAIVLFVGVFVNLIRLQAVTQHGGRATQAARIEVFGCRDENALGVRIHLAA